MHTSKSTTHWACNEQLKKFGNKVPCCFCKQHYRCDGFKKMPKKIRLKISRSRMDNKNPNWKGDEVGYAALHTWIKKRLDKPRRCEDCRKIKRLDLANISQKYKRELTDWEWLCRQCHMNKDGRTKRLLDAIKKKSRELRRNLPKKKCDNCGKAYKRNIFRQSERVEDKKIFNKRKFCSNLCSNRFNGKKRESINASLRGEKQNLASLSQETT